MRGNSFKQKEHKKGYLKSLFALSIIVFNINVSIINIREHTV